MTDPCAPAEPAPSPGDSYLGSVRFFKHLILTVLALLMLIPTTLSVVFGMSLGWTRTELSEVQLRVS